MGLGRDLREVDWAALLEGKVARHGHLERGETILAGRGHVAPLFQDLAERLNRAAEERHTGRERA